MSVRGPSGNWLTVTVDGTGISPRYGLAACLAADGFVYCFGGITNEDDSYFADLRRFRVSSGDSSVHWELVNATGACPQGRDGHGLFSVGRKLYLLGGVTASEDAKFNDQITVFNIDDQSWEDITVTGTWPNATSSSYCSIGEKIFVFGGVFDGEPTNTVYMLDTVGLKWTLLECAGTPPARRCDHAACAIGDVMYVFGGSGGEDLLFRDVFQLDASTLTWSEVDVTGSATPGTRDYCTLVPYGKEGLLVFGGSRDVKAVSDMYYLDLKKKAAEWRVMEPEGERPAGRFSHTSLISSNTMVVVAGTCTPEGSGADQDVNDVCLLHLPDLKLVEENSSFEPTAPPTNHLANPPQPSRRRVIPAPKLVSARDFEETKQNILKSITESFDQMVEAYLKLDQEKETLRVDKAGLEEDRRQLEKMQKEHEDLFERQRRSNEEWLEDRRVENDKERQAIANEKATLTRERAQLEQERDTFDQKNKKLEGIMNQFKGIG